MAQGKKTGGRKPGTPNKVDARVRQAFADMLDAYLGNNGTRFQEDLDALESKDRLVLIERFASYVVPKLQATTLDIETQKKRTIEDALAELAEE